MSSRKSLMTTRVSVTLSRPKSVRKRSCVSGRGGVTPWSGTAIPVASASPIAIASCRRSRLPWRTTVGCWERWSSRTATTSTSGGPETSHDMFLVGWTAEEGGWGSLDSAAIARTARALAATHVALVPTLALHEIFSRLTDTALLSRRWMQDVPADNAGIRDVRGLIARAGWQTPEFIAFRRSRPKQNQFVREFKRAGGLIAAGSDAANQMLVPGAALHEELEQLVAAGLTPIEAITAAPRHGAELLHADSLGRVAVGKLADLVVLNARPDSNITATRDIMLVMARGRVLKPDSLRQAWKQ